MPEEKSSSSASLFTRHEKLQQDKFTAPLGCTEAYRAFKE